MIPTGSDFSEQPVWDWLDAHTSFEACAEDLQCQIGRAGHGSGRVAENTDVRTARWEFGLATIDVTFWLPELMSRSPHERGQLAVPTAQLAGSRGRRPVPDLGPLARDPHRGRRVSAAVRSHSARGGGGSGLRTAFVGGVEVALLDANKPFTLDEAAERIRGRLGVPLDTSTQPDA